MEENSVQNALYTVRGRARRFRLLVGTANDVFDASRISEYFDQILRPLALLHIWRSRSQYGECHLEGTKKPRSRGTLLLYIYHNST